VAHRLGGGCEVIQRGDDDIPAHVEGVAVGQVSDPELDGYVDQVAIVAEHVAELLRVSLDPPIPVGNLD
jgi:hypothetical protein